MQLFADPQLPLHEQLEAYEHKGGWVNRLILGDSLVVMNSLLEYEGLGGQVQMIYIDPPYGVEFGSNFQPFVRTHDVKSGDQDMTREPEMVKAYRDTWDLGLHSYLAYLKDRLTVARNLLTVTGSLFLQIGDANVHHARELLDEVFGAENFVVSIFIRKKGSQRGSEIKPINDYVLWYARDRQRVKRRFLYDSKLDAADLADEFEYIELADGTSERSGSFRPEELDELIRSGAKLYVPEPLTSGGEYRTQLYSVEYDGRTFRPPANNCWKFNEAGMNRIIADGRLHVGRNQIRFKKYHTDFPFTALNNLWDDMAGASNKVYVVQTATKAVQRCLLMTTDAGDLVLDPTCGSGTTAYVAEHWGRRWITIDTSRVPVALARQRLLTATFPYYELQDELRGPAGGFGYRRRQNKRGDEVGGVVPHVTSTSIANDEPPAEEVLVDRPEVEKSITRVTGPFVVEATIPTPVDFEGDGIEDSGVPSDASYVDRMLEALTRNPRIQLPGREVSLRNVRQPARTLTLSAEAALEPDDAPVAIVFGPENGAVSEKLVYEAAREAHMKHYEQLLVIGFAIEPNARTLVDKIESQIGIPATYVQATPDLVMGDLLKTMRSSQLFSVAGLPDVAIRKVDPEEQGGPQRYEVELLGLDTFDPTTMESEHRQGGDVPAWLLDTAWNGLSFHVSQAFFPRTSAWDNLRKALKTEFDEAVWDHLAGTTSAPFTAGASGEVAVKVIDDRGNELLVVKNLAEAT
ncbi:MAG TPA: site-specific DNA-methyltransferase, partial [Gaiellaceae bacterium]|nr:site-specific DNA-methyltransferase [Gaiellaceae bacterium]